MGRLQIKIFFLEIQQPNDVRIEALDPFQIWILTTKSEIERIGRVSRRNDGGLKQKESTVKKSRG